MNYRKDIFEKSWKKLVENALNGKFNPLSEGDVQAYLYYLCLNKINNPLMIHAEWRGQKRKEMDLMLGEKELVINIKWKMIRKPFLKNKKLIEDLKKLSEQNNVKEKAFAIIFRKKNSPFPTNLKELTKRQQEIINGIIKEAKKRGIKVYTTFSLK